MNARHTFNFLCAALFALFSLITTAAQAQSPVLTTFLGQVPAGDLVAGADSYGPIRSDLPVAAVRKNGETIGWAFITSDFVGTTGYSGKPIHTMVAVDADAQIIGISLVKHSEPIVLIGIPDAKMKALVAKYIGLDLVAEAMTGGEAHKLNIISGATVTVIVIDDSIVRTGIMVARALGLGGLAAKLTDTGPKFEIDPTAQAAGDWTTLEGDGTIRRLLLDVDQINTAFAALEDKRAARRPVKAPADATFIDMQVALVSVPGIGHTLLGDAEYNNLEAWLKDGESAIMVAGRGLYSFKGSGYVRGGIFDRIVLIQDDISVRFHDRDHRRLGNIAADGAPEFPELDLFRIPADSGFDPTKPFHLQLLVQRPVAAIEKVFTTFDLGYQLPSKYLNPVAAAPAIPASVAASEEQLAAQNALWQRVWRSKTVEIAGLVAMLLVLTTAFFFQTYVTRSERFTFWYRISFL
ncbi:MAG: FMN-binding protein, partial [Parvibaculum sp.]|nr:FMN-binding protein [Parvibaculum sp.]